VHSAAQRRSPPRNTGTSTLEAISRALNHKGIRTVRGGHTGTFQTVANLLARAQKLDGSVAAEPIERSSTLL
jgi:hypothetical protein